ncbi:hypothetical protein YB2330_001490 [Saitoella coloradoensis]
MSKIHDHSHAIHAPRPIATSPPSSTQTSTPTPEGWRPRLRTPIYLLPTHIDPSDVSTLTGILRLHPSRTIVSTPFEAKIIVTALTSEKRIKREIMWGTRRAEYKEDEVIIVDVEWLRRGGWEVREVEVIGRYIRDKGDVDHSRPTKRQCLDSEGELDDLRNQDKRRREVLLRARADADRNVGDAKPSRWSTSRLGPSSHSRPLPHASSHEPVPVLPPSLPTLSTEETHPEQPPARPLPEWIFNKYACERQTPLICPNQSFADALSTIKLARELSGDRVGVRAYASAIAAVKAFPYAFVEGGERELGKVPGVGQKITMLTREWLQTGRLTEVEALEKDEEFTTCRLFWNIWGVGPSTAKHLYQQGFRTLEDVKLQHWGRLTREQQIGLKYFDDIGKRIPRGEVAELGRIIHAMAVEITDGVDGRNGLHSVICGGYRRGKEMSGDVDIIMTHRTQWQHLVQRLTEALEKVGWVTHVLSISKSMSERGGHPPELHEEKGIWESGWGGGDSLDKALLVFRSPTTPPGSEAKILHRRVDIIISPPSAFGTAIAGWTGGTTFERDLRRLLKERKRWRFDSGGVVDRGTGHVVDFGEWETAEEAERGVFKGFEVAWIDPELRNTG